MSSKDPRKLYKQPPYSEKEQPPPGSEEEMSPKVDHGESSYEGTGRLKARHALITGADSGIGRAVALAFAREGADVAISYLSEERDALETQRLVTEAGRKAVLLPGDIGERSVCQSVAQQAIDALGTIDILVNNAAFFNKKGVIDMSFEEWNRQTGVILGGAFLFTKHACKAMIAQAMGGAVINIISTAGHQGEPGNIAYSTSKCGLLNFTRSAAMELVGSGIRVNSLTPTATDPDESFERAARWGRTVRRPESLDRVMKPFRSRIPMQKLPVPSDYGRAAVFLASDDARMITGTDLRVDAGAIARYWAWDPTAGAAL